MLLYLLCSIIEKYRFEFAQSTVSLSMALELWSLKFPLNAIAQLEKKVMKMKLNETIHHFVPHI